MKKENIVVIGAGPAGMMAAIAVSSAGGSAALLEKNPTLGRKLLLTGNGRCNFTNVADIETFMSKFGKNGSFLRDAYNAFPPAEVIKFLENRGLKCKVEEEGRVFPFKERSAALLSILEKEMAFSGVTIAKGIAVKDLSVKNNQIYEVKLAGGETIQCKTVILSTGGVSYPETGSSGDGFSFASKLGHSIVPPRAGLVPVIVKEDHAALLSGLSLSGISIRIPSRRRVLSTAKGDIMFTSHGLSGPVILSNSGIISGLLGEGKEVSIIIDISPDTPAEDIERLVSSKIENEPAKNIKNCLKDLAPKRLLDLILSLSLSDPEKIANQVTREERSHLARLCKNLKFTVAGTSPIEDAMVTIGGVSLKEIDPKTMSSRIVRGLYFAGEILDIAGDTGGYNLQAAFSTGYLAGISAAKKNPS